jgi:nicotinate-nucleotide pyrophosphorylase (carboxylating)
MDYVNDDLIRLALREDLGMGDITSELLFSYDHRSAAAIIAKSPGIISGLALARRVFEMIDDTVEICPHMQDGDFAEKGAIVMEVAGRTRKLLAGERTAINFLMHLSGVATATYELQQKLRDVGCSVRITDTRKTTPIWRFAEKRAVRDGGGLNHRFSLSDGVLIKDNHLLFYKDPAEAVRCAKAQCRRVDMVEVEVTELAQVAPCLEAGADIVMLDNMTPDEIREAVKLIAGRARIEVSGGVNPDNILDYAIEGVDIISLGYITHSAPSLDFSMEMMREVAN